MGTQPDDQEDAPPIESAESVGTVEGEAPRVATAEPIPSTRTSRLWIRILPALVVLAVILIFVFQNPKDVKVRIFMFTGTLPLSVALLGACALGALLVLALGSVRIFQLRRQVRKRERDPQADRS